MGKAITIPGTADRISLCRMGWRLLRIVLVVGFLAMSIASAQAMQILYATGSSQSGVGSALYTVDPLIGTASLAWEFPSIFVHAGGLAYDSAADTLYATGYDNTSQATLFTINRFTGAAAAVGYTGGGALEFGGLAINPLTGVMYATGTNGTPSTGLFTINKTTGAATH